MFELQSLLNYSAQQSVSRWGTDLIDTLLSAQMNLCYGLVVSPGRLFDLEISEFALYAAFTAVKLKQSPEKDLLCGQGASLRACLKYLEISRFGRFSWFCGVISVSTLKTKHTL